MANYKVLATWDISIQNLYKDITLIQQGISCKLNISLRSISRVTVNYKVGSEYVTDLCTIDLDNNKVIVPFKKNVLEVGTHALELVCHMKNGDVLPTPNYSYTVTKSLDNTNDITEEDAYPVLIGMIQELTKNEAVIQANEEARANAEMYRELHEDERQNAEAERKANENTRISNENTRQSNESNRQQYETQRRVEEDERLTDEQVRVNAENIRIANENERLRKEIERQNAEELRQISYNSSLYGRMDEAEDRLDVVDSQSAQNANRIPHVNIKDFGAKGDGVTDDTEAIKKAIATGHNVLIPEGQFLVTDTLSLNTSLELFGANRAKSILKTPYEFGANKPLLKIDSQKVHIHGFSIEGNIGNPENITHDKKYPDSCGIAIHIPSTSNRQWSRIENLFISGMDIGLSYSSTYYHNAIRVEINNCNKAIVFTNKPVGSINIYDSHIRDNRIVGIYSEGCNNVNITNCIFEWNKYHIYTNSSMGDGGISFTGCYLSDGPYKAIYMNGGKVNIDSCNSNYIAGTGGRMSQTYPNGYYPDQEVKDAKTEYITCNIDVKGGELYVKNTVLGQGSWGNVGYTFGTPDNGNGIEIKGDSKVVFDNVLFSEGGFLHPESNDDSLYYSDKIENYIVNGNLYSINNIPNSFSGITSSNLTYETKKSPYGGNSIKIDVTATSYIKFKFKVPEKLVGEVLLLGMVVGKGSNLINTILFPENQSFNYIDIDKYYYPSKAMSGSNRLINFSSFKDMTEWMYAPITVNNVSGEINFKIQQYDTSKSAILNIHSVFLIERRNFRKIGLLEDVNTI